MVAAKDDFRSACESSGGSFVEHANGEYSCNTPSGISIRCRSDGQRCWIAAAITDGVTINVDVSPIGIQPVFDLPVATGIRPGRLPTSSG